jgi:hypothetical protein
MGVSHHPFPSPPSNPPPLARVTLASSFVFFLSRRYERAFVLWRIVWSVRRIRLSRLFRWSSKTWL